MSDNGTMRSRRPQLNDTITKLDQMVDGLATAIPGAVADSIREVLGPAFVTAIKDAVTQAVAEALKAQNIESAKLAPVPSPMPTPTSPPRPKPDRWLKVKSALAYLRALTQVKTWAMKTVAPVVAQAALGWAVVKVVGGATVHSRTATLITALTGTVAGIVGFTLGPVGAAVLLGLVTGMIAATAVWAAPAARLLVALQED